MRALPLVALAFGLMALPADAGPKHGFRTTAPAPMQGLERVWWHAGGVGPGGGAWHAGGGRWGGAYHYGGGFHRYVGGYHGYPGGFWRRPVAVAPFYHPPFGAFAAGAVVGAAAGAAAGSAAASVATYGQPTTVINNYY